MMRANQECCLKEVTQPLTHPESVRVAGAAIVQRLQRALIVAGGIDVGVDGPRPVTGSDQVTGPAWLVGAQAPVMPEHLQILESLRAGAAEGFQRLADPRV